MRYKFWKGDGDGEGGLVPDPDGEWVRFSSALARTPTPAAPSVEPATMLCEDCDGRGTEGPEVYQGEFQPPERSPCSSCGGSGRWRCPPLHPFTNDLVDRFAVALKFKLAAAERKYGHSEGWARDDWMDECRLQLIEHIEKGDPRDVAAYCAFLWHHGESTSAIEADIAENADYLADGEAA